MIQLENIKYDSDKYCFVCNRKDDSAKTINFSVAENKQFLVVGICKKCRNILKNLLEEEDEE